MSKTTKTTEQAQIEALNKAIGRLMRQRSWQGDWRIIDDRLTDRHVTWDFFRHANTGVAAVSPVTVNDKQWWVVASYGYNVDPGMFLILGLIGGMFAKKRLQFQF